MVTCISRTSSLTSFRSGYELSRFLRIWSQPRVTVPLLLKSSSCLEFQYGAVTSSTFACRIPSRILLKEVSTASDPGAVAVLFVPAGVDFGVAEVLGVGVVAGLLFVFEFVVRGRPLVVDEFVLDEFMF